METTWRIEYRESPDGEWKEYVDSNPDDEPTETFLYALSKTERNMRYNKQITEWRLVKVTTEVVRHATREEVERAEKEAAK